MKRIYLFLIALILILCVAVCAQAAEIRPYGDGHMETDLRDGVFCVGFKDIDKIDKGGWFTAVLYHEDHYEAEKIEELAGGDVVYVNGVPWTVREIITHVQDDADSTEIYTEEDLDGYIAFFPAGDGCYQCLMNDWSPVIEAAEVKIMLPLPDAFEFASFGADDYGSADDFIESLKEGDPFTPYNTSCVFDDGLLVRVTHSSYPEGPEIVPEAADEIPVWQFCHGVREGLETAVIRGYKNDCDAGPEAYEMTEEEIADVRNLAIHGVITGKANDMSVTGGTWSYVFENEEGKVILAIEMYKGWIVSVDGMYNYEK